MFSKNEDGQIEIVLAFKENFPNLNSNVQQAERSLIGLKTQFQKNPEYHQEPKDFIQNKMSSGFVGNVSEEEYEANDCWYIIHHGVYYKQKGKLCVVFNCFFKYHGNSLSEFLLQGFDLTNSLTSVSMRFHQKKNGVTGDIDKMFYQMMVSPEHTKYITFLWLNDNNETVQYAINVHVFGAVSSRSVANYTLRSTAEDCRPLEMKKIILVAIYVDELLVSLSTEEEALGTIENLNETLKKNHFNLTELKSNTTFLWKILGKKIV